MASNLDLSQIDTIIFDFDGTLHRGEELSLPIFEQCLKSLFEKYKISKEYPTTEEILSQFGKQTEDIYPSLLKTNDPDMIEFFSKCVEQSEVLAFNAGKGTLYPKVLETLDTLKKRKFKLALCTNARMDYFEAVVKRFKLADYFDLMTAAGQYPGKNKIWMVKNILNELNSKNFVVVGDRVHDIEAAKVNGGISIGCAYGFGSNEVNNADIRITAFEELQTIFR
ncbi:MAG: HAD family hydrolase [Candidatus Hodarchaeota archaeon]